MVSSLSEFEGYGLVPAAATVDRLKFTRDRGEGPIQVTANRLHRGNDHNRNAGGDQTVFDRGRA